MTPIARLRSTPSVFGVPTARRRLPGGTRRASGRLNARRGEAAFDGMRKNA